ncbi:hypothetical protein T4E_9508 [Trichinella pseudospiralis]|uniref:Uncharacterized protein n=1 Tax=Trichinella pseudospiralis TaxID=6337 RepID=A0A0V0XUL6_TRIPS|nr:hypothetical protein T4E_9508 [Trichinella pseudospiralis]
MKRCLVNDILHCPWEQVATAISEQDQLHADRQFVSIDELLAHCVHQRKYVTHWIGRHLAERDSQKAVPDVAVRINHCLQSGHWFRNPGIVTVDQQKVVLLLGRIPAAQWRAHHDRLHQRQTELGMTGRFTLVRCSGW